MKKPSFEENMKDRAREMQTLHNMAEEFPNKPIYRGKLRAMMDVTEKIRYRKAREAGIPIKFPI